MSTKIIGSVRVRHTPSGGTSVTVTLKRGSLSASWTEKCYRHTIQDATVAARVAARAALDASLLAITQDKEIDT